MSSQPPYGNDPQNPYPQTGPQPGYGQQPGYEQSPVYNQQPVYEQPQGFPQQPGGYPPAQYGAPAAPYEQPDRRGGLAIAALVLGILSILGSLLTFLDLPLIILGIIFGILGRASVRRRTLATVGLVLSIIGLLIVVGLLVAAAAFVKNNPNAFPTATP